MNTPDSRFLWTGNDRLNGQAGGGHTHLEPGETNGCLARNQPGAYTHGYRPDAPPEHQSFLPPCHYEIRWNEFGGGGYIIIVDLFSNDSGPMLVFD